MFGAEYGGIFHNNWNFGRSKVRRQRDGNHVTAARYQYGFIGLPSSQRVVDNEVAVFIKFDKQKFHRVPAESASEVKFIPPITLKESLQPAYPL